MHPEHEERNSERREHGAEGHRGGPRGPREHGGRGLGGARRGRGGFGRPGGWQQADLPSADDAPAWFTGRLPGDWFTEAPSISVDREEIHVVGTLAAPQAATSDSGETQSADADTAAALGRISRFREDTRADRIKIALEAEARYGRKVAWGARIGSTEELFSHLAVPVMTRLRQSERQVLDTLVDAGVARSRSEALAWCVQLVGDHTDEWLSGLREAMTQVDKLRSEGPSI